MKSFFRSAGLLLSLGAFGCTVPGTLDLTLHEDGATTGQDAGRDASTSEADAAEGDASTGATGRDAGDAPSGSRNDAGSQEEDAGDEGREDASGGADEEDAGSGPDDSEDYFGSPRCEQSDFLICEDFETEAPGQRANPAVWNTANERIVVDATRAARGKQALRIDTTSLQATHFMQTTPLPEALQRKLWGRLFVWVDKRPTEFSHWTIVEVTGPHSAGGDTRIRYGGISIPDVENHLDFNYDIWGSDEQRPPGFQEVSLEMAGQDTPDGVWHCFEWMFDADNREARFFWDDDEADWLHAKDSIGTVELEFPTFAGLNVGWATYQQLSSEWSVWIDEVAVHTSRIGCAK